MDQSSMELKFSLFPTLFHYISFNLNIGDDRSNKMQKQKFQEYYSKFSIMVDLKGVGINDTWYVVRYGSCYGNRNTKYIHEELGMLGNKINDKR